MKKILTVKTYLDKRDISSYGKKIRIVSIPAHSLTLETEGENLTNSPFDFEMLQQSINMVVPKNHMFKKK